MWSVTFNMSALRVMLSGKTAVVDNHVSRKSGLVDMVVVSQPQPHTIIQAVAVKKKKKRSSQDLNRCPSTNEVRSFSAIL